MHFPPKKVDPSGSIYTKATGITEELSAAGWLQLQIRDKQQLLLRHSMHFVALQESKRSCRNKLPPYQLITISRIIHCHVQEHASWQIAGDDDGNWFCPWRVESPRCMVQELTDSQIQIEASTKTSCARQLDHSRFHVDCMLRCCAQYANALQSRQQLP